MSSKNKPYIIGLTGGIGAGKSEACDILQRLGAYIIDADIVSREVSKEGQRGYEALKKEFPLFFDGNGSLLRRELRDHVFSNKLSGRLDEIMHPIIIEEIHDRIFSSSRGHIVIAAPLLFESGMDKICDVIISIFAKKERRISRIAARDNTDSEMAKRIIESQVGEEEMRKRSDIIIENDEDLDELECKIKFYYEEIKKGIKDNN